MLFTPAPHKESSAFVRSKPVVSRSVFNGLLPELKARAFTVSGVESMTVLQSIRDRIASLPSGAQWDTVKAKMVQEISPWLATGDNAEAKEKAIKAAQARATLLLRMHGFQAYAASAYQVMDRQRQVFPYWKYVSMGDGRVRDTHAALNGKILPADSEFWQGHYPPWEWGCRCQVVPLMKEDVDEVRVEEEKLPPEERNIIEGVSLKVLEEQGKLISGINKIYDVRLPSQKGQPGFEWRPGDLSLTVAQLAERYSPEVWEAFSTWAKEVKLSQNKTLWQWLNPATPKTAKQPEGLPTSLDGLKLAKNLGGSTGAQLYASPDGRQWVVKRGANPDHLIEEHTADTLYTLLGVPVPPSVIIQTPTGPVKVAQFIEGRSLKDYLKSATSAEFEVVMDRLRAHFVVDALLGNWDVVGLNLDNILVDDTGTPWRIDNGGSLRHRAQGALKTATQWGADVGEIASLRNPHVNKQTSIIFGGMREGDVIAQIRDVLTRREEIEATAPAALRAMLTARLNNLATRLPESGGLATQTITPQFVKATQKAGALGRTYLGDKESVEDHSILFWQEGTGVDTTTRAKLKISEKGWDAIKAKLQHILPATATTLKSDAFWPAIESGLKTAGAHAADGAYNSNTLKEVATVKAQLTAWQPTTAEEKAMKAEYLDAIAAIDTAVNQKAPPARQYKQYVPPPPKLTDVARSDVQVSSEPMVYPTKEQRDGQILGEAGGISQTVSGSYKITVGDVTVSVSPWDRAIPYSHRGVAMVTVPGNVSPENLEKVLTAIKEMGVDVSPTSPETAELLYLRKGLQLAKPKAASWQAIADSDRPDTEKVTELRAWVKRYLKIDTETSPDYRPQGEGNAQGDGWTKWQRFDLPPHAITQELSGWGLTHETKDTIVSMVSSILDGGGQATSTMERMRVGVSVSIGMSPITDQATGGSSYFFTRIASPASINQVRRGLVFKIGALSRMDMFSFNHDRFGDVRPQGENGGKSSPHTARARTIADFKRYSLIRRNEAIFKHGLNLLDDVQAIHVRDASEQQQVIQEFKRRGHYTLPDGRKVEDIVIIK